ncbi:branched-chain amino acid ABC transporter permease [Sporosarcina sp. Marseille-Q4063]|uniref:branched-chain amino acid ABC transporter permease n=1 Tax=Sporosarcina sp. Marseille-Q4063 TaxID=2810514 RepID=UPI001BAEBDD4|nr:branched-chain amino acid ABC transporter permease [Sporosarcina sp. Marseille-Q4063]QUW22339.1 branched-chain amino acid ABC transporter permease [Sporosarcina sp. Marseille-Q4063]
MKRTFQWNNVLLGIIVVALAIFPFISDSRTWTILLTQIFIFSILGMSYDILLGYTGIVSFGHAMFFGMGAYTTAVMLKNIEPTMGVFLLSIGAGMVIAGTISFFIGLLTLRLKTHFFAMFTLAVSGLFLVLAEKWRTVTHGNDGFTFKAPEFFKDRIMFYCAALFCLVLVYFFLRRFVNSPFGRILVAVRENEQRTLSLGFNTLHYKVIASVVAGVVASLAGSLYAVSLRFVNTSVLSLDITLDALLMTIIGGVGTLIGPILGAGIIELSQHYLSGLAKEYPIFERWIIFFGITFILAVIFFPKGVVGTLREKLWKRRTKTTKENAKKEGL